MSVRVTEIYAGLAPQYDSDIEKLNIPEHEGIADATPLRRIAMWYSNLQRELLSIFAIHHIISCSKEERSYSR